MKSLCTTLALSAIVGSCCLFACSKDEVVKLDSASTLQLIQADILHETYYPQEVNQYNYSSDKFAQAVQSMPTLFEYRVNNSSTKKNTIITTKEYKTKALQLYSPLGHDSVEVNNLFKTTQSMISSSSNYNKLLNDLSNSGVIPTEESKILKDYLNLFYSEGSRDSFLKKLLYTFTT